MIVNIVFYVFLESLEMKPQTQFIRAKELTKSDRAEQISARATRAQSRAKSCSYEFNSAAVKENIKPDNTPAKLGRKRGRDEQGNLTNDRSKRGPYNSTASAKISGEYSTPTNAASNQMFEQKNKTQAPDVETMQLSAYEQSLMPEGGKGFDDINDILSGFNF